MHTQGHAKNITPFYSVPVSREQHLVAAITSGFISLNDGNDADFKKKSKHFRV